MTDLRLFSRSDIGETLAGMRSALAILGPKRGGRALLTAAAGHLRALRAGQGDYPEPGKRRVWHKLHYLKQVYDFLGEHEPNQADELFGQILEAPARRYIGQFFPPPSRFSRDFVLHQALPQLVHNDYNIEATVHRTGEHSVSLCVTRCFIHEVVQDVGLGPVADAICHGDFVFWQGFHPSVRFSRTKRLLAGDDCCDHTLTWIEP